MKKLQTLRNSQQFRKVYDQGQRFHTPLFSAFLLKTETNEQRVGITVTRKIGNAVVRNRCKRRLREALKKFGDRLSGMSGFDLVINAKSNLVEADFIQIVDAMAKAIDRVSNSRTKTDS